MSDNKTEYVHVHFREAITPPSTASTHGIERSVFLDAFVGDSSHRRRVFELVKVGDTVRATAVGTGVIRDYPWALVRQALRADNAYINGDPRQGKRGGK